MLDRFRFKSPRVPRIFASVFAASALAVSASGFGQAQPSRVSGTDQTPSAGTAELPDNDLEVRALEYFRHGDCANAEPIFEKILLRQPKNIAIRKLLANCYLQDKKLDEAKIQYQLVLEAAPRDVEADQGLKASMGEIQKKEVEPQTRTIQSRAAKSEELRSSHELSEAETLIKAHRLDEAEKILNGIVGRNPESPEAQQRLAEIYSTTRRLDKAAAVYMALAQRPKASPEFLLRAAQNLEWDKNYTRAAEDYRLYLKKRPNSSQALLAVARILTQEENYVEAPRYYRLYLRLNPRDLAARTTLANMLMGSGDYSEAAPEFEKLKAAEPKNFRARLALAQCYQQMDQKNKALEAYQEVLRLDPRNPAALKARSEYLRYFDELPRQQAYAALARNDDVAAARYFIQYSEKHPENTDMLLQIARVYSWGRRDAEAEKYYEAYLKRAPGDAPIVREVARLEMGAKQYAKARSYYEILTRAPQATNEDYEGLLHTYTWSGDLAGAQPVAQKLARLEPKNADARRALNDFAERNRIAAEQKRLAERTRAEELAAAQRYPEAIAAYRSYMAHYGADRQTELLVPRLYSWGRDYSESARQYQTYLAKFPTDTQARLELANVENWSGHYGEAENDYRSVLRQSPQNANALVGVAQVEDYEQRDPFEVRNDYLSVLKVEPRNALAERRLEEIRPLVAPAFTFSANAFADSDDVFRSVGSIEMTFPVPGRVKLTPFFNFGYFHQNVAHARLTNYGNGGGGRIEISRPGGVSFLAELGGVYWSESEKLGTGQFDANRASVYAHGAGSFRAGNSNTFGFDYAHKDAVYDLTTAQALTAGIMEDTLMVSYQRPISERVKLWTTAGVSHYTPGTLTSSFSLPACVANPCAANTQPRFSARLDFQAKPWITLGYSTRISGFRSASPIYFSPTLYQTHGLSYTLSKTIGRNFFISADGEFDYGRIGTHRMAAPVGPSATTTGASVNSFELAAVPHLKWRLSRRGITLQAGLRFSRGSAGSSVKAPGTIYRTGGAEFSVVKVF